MCWLCQVLHWLKCLLWSAFSFLLHWLQQCHCSLACMGWIERVGFPNLCRMPRIVHPSKIGDHHQCRWLLGLRNEWSDLWWHQWLGWFWRLTHMCEYEGSHCTDLQRLGRTFLLLAPSPYEHIGRGSEIFDEWELFLFYLKVCILRRSDRTWHDCLHLWSCMATIVMFLLWQAFSRLPDACHGVLRDRSWQGWKVPQVGCLYIGDFQSLIEALLLLHNMVFHHLEWVLRWLQGIQLWHIGRFSGKVHPDMRIVLALRASGLWFQQCWWQLGCLIGQDWCGWLVQLLLDLGFQFQQSLKAFPLQQKHLHQFHQFHWLWPMDVLRECQLQCFLHPWSIVWWMLGVQLSFWGVGVFCSWCLVMTACQGLGPEAGGRSRFQIWILAILPQTLHIFDKPMQWRAFPTHTLHTWFRLRWEILSQLGLFSIDHFLAAAWVQIPGHWVWKHQQWVWSASWGSNRPRPFLKQDVLWQPEMLFDVLEARETVFPFWGGSWEVPAWMLFHHWSEPVDLLGHEMIWHQLHFWGLETQQVPCSVLDPVCTHFGWVDIHQITLLIYPIGFSFDWGLYLQLCKLWRIFLSFAKVPLWCSLSGAYLL